MKHYKNIQSIFFFCLYFIFTDQLFCMNNALSPANAQYLTDIKNNIHKHVPISESDYKFLCGNVDQISNRWKKNHRWCAVEKSFCTRLMDAVKHEGVGVWATLYSLEMALFCTPSWPCSVFFMTQSTLILSDEYKNTEPYVKMVVPQS